MKKKYALALALLLPVSLLLVAACDKASPVAPAGTVLTLSVSPSQITANGTATVLVTALKSNGTPVNPGTQIRFGTSLGTIDPVAEIGDDGVATATLRGTGEIGTATVTARAGTTEAVTAEVEIGKTAGNVTLQATPSSVPETGGTVSLLALVRDDQGQPLPNASVNFATEVGILASGGNFVTTGADGAARDTLQVRDSDLTALGADEFEVSVQVGGSGGEARTESFVVKVQRPPQADFVCTSNRLSVACEDRSTNNPTSWLWEFGDGTTSRSQNPGHSYGAPETYPVTLTVRNAIGESSTTQFVTVSSSG